VRRLCENNLVHRDIKPETSCRESARAGDRLRRRPRHGRRSGRDPSPDHRGLVGSGLSPERATADPATVTAPISMRSGFSPTRCSRGGRHSARVRRRFSTGDGGAARSRRCARTSRRASKQSS
jgi:hypothetical protein